MGAPASIRTMQKVIEKAKSSGTAFGCVRNSNHFGIAGYYAMMALPENMLGIAMTNTAALGVPTFGRQVNVRYQSDRFLCTRRQGKSLRSR